VFHRLRALFLFIDTARVKSSFYSDSRGVNIRHLRCEIVHPSTSCQVLMSVKFITCLFHHLCPSSSVTWHASCCARNVKGTALNMRFRSPLIALSGSDVGPCTYTSIHTFFVLMDQMIWNKQDVTSGGYVALVLDVWIAGECNTRFNSLLLLPASLYSWYDDFVGMMDKIIFRHPKGNYISIEDFTGARRCFFNADKRALVSQGHEQVHVISERFLNV
jgi:hypothetical protein